MWLGAPTLYTMIFAMWQMTCACKGLACPCSLILIFCQTIGLSISFFVTVGNVHIGLCVSFQGRTVTLPKCNMALYFSKVLPWARIRVGDINQIKTERKAYFLPALRVFKVRSDRCTWAVSLWPQVISASILSHTWSNYNFPTSSVFCYPFALEEICPLQISKLTNNYLLMWLRNSTMTPWIYGLTNATFIPNEVGPRSATSIIVRIFQWLEGALVCGPL